MAKETKKDGKWTVETALAFLKRKGAKIGLAAKDADGKETGKIPVTMNREKSKVGNGTLGVIDFLNWHSNYRVTVKG